MKMIVCLLACLVVVAATPLEAERSSVEPEYLDQLLKEKRYDEFSAIMQLGNPKLAYSKQEAAPRTRHEAMFNIDLERGDLVLTEEQREQARQGINFQRYGGSKWPNGEVPYWISRDYSRSEMDIVQRGINKWNSKVRCIKFRNWRQGDKDYVHFFPGDGCYARLGRAGGEQPLSLDRNGCLYDGTTIHEMEHAIGFAHEQNRHDRDDKIQMIWENIPEEWKPQYKKTDPGDYGLQGLYDYYSIMHYPVTAPGTNKRAFWVKTDGIDERRIGNGNDFTQMDLQKICELYS